MTIRAQKHLTESVYLKKIDSWRYQLFSIEVKTRNKISPSSHVQANIYSLGQYLSIDPRLQPFLIGKEIKQ